MNRIVKIIVISLLAITILLGVGIALIYEYGTKPMVDNMMDQIQCMDICRMTTRDPNASYSECMKMCEEIPDGR